MNKIPFEIKMKNIMEIRMGSPYNSCELEIKNLEINIPKGGWQDKYAWSDDFRFLILIRWNLEKNEPGFNFHIIDFNTNEIIVKERRRGLINELRSDGKLIFYKVFQNGEIKMELEKII